MSVGKTGEMLVREGGEEENETNVWEEKDMSYNIKWN